MALHSKAGSLALDRAGLEAASAQHAGDRARQQARAHRLGGPRTRSLLSAEDHHQCLTPARSGPPRGCPHPSPPPSLTTLGERATVAPRGWLHLISLTSNRIENGLSTSIRSFPTEVCEME